MPDSDLKNDELEIFETFISDFEPHIRGGQFVFVDETLDLLETAQLIKNDRAAEMEKLLKEGKVFKANLNNFHQWKIENVKFRFVILQPFVIATKILIEN